MSDFEQQLYRIGKMVAEQRRQELEDEFDQMKIDCIASKARATKFGPSPMPSNVPAWSKGT